MRRLIQHFGELLAALILIAAIVFLVLWLPRDLAAAQSAGEQLKAKKTQFNACKTKAKVAYDAHKAARGDDAGWGAQETYVKTFNQCMSKKV